jgi:hypothetical protein
MSKVKRPVEFFKKAVEETLGSLGVVVSVNKEKRRRTFSY